VQAASDAVALEWRVSEMMCVFERQSLTALKAGKCARRVEWMKAFCMFYRSTPSFAYNFDYTLGRGWMDGERE
jgi:hypothetical protein